MSMFFNDVEDYKYETYGPFKLCDNNGDVVGSYYSGYIDDPDSDPDMFDEHQMTKGGLVERLREKEVEAIKLGRGIDEVMVLDKDVYCYHILDTPILIKMEKVIYELRAGNVTVKEFIKQYLDTRKESRIIAQEKRDAEGEEWRKDNPELVLESRRRWAARDKVMFNQLAGI